MVPLWYAAALVENGERLIADKSTPQLWFADTSLFMLGTISVVLVSSQRTQRISVSCL